MDALLLAIVFVFSLIAQQLKLPPLVGFMISGFVLQAMGNFYAAESLQGCEFHAVVAATDKFVVELRELCCLISELRLVYTSKPVTDSPVMSVESYVSSGRI